MRSDNPNKDGGPAFPCGPFGDTMHGEDGRQWHQHDRMPGMSLRDWFAGQIAVGLISKIPLIDQKGELGVTVLDKHKLNADIAESCYWLADAMLAQREKDQAQ